jgi:hypothetical protein
MLEQYFMPLERHFDGGFHATADAFKAAAEKLSMHDDRASRAFHAHLSVNYLYRHAIELYLKSMVLILTRVFANSDTPLDPAKIKLHGYGSKPLTTVHSLKTLLDEVQQLVTSNASKISRLTSSNWNVPSELQSWIDTIEQHDSGSTFSRYPTSKSMLDSVKSSFQPVDPESLLRSMNEHKPDDRKHFVLLMKNDDDEIVEAFSLQDDILPELRKALVEASNLLSGAVFGLQSELVDGLGLKMKQRKNAPGEKDKPLRDDSEYQQFIQILEPRLGEIVETAQRSLGNEFVLVCCDVSKIETAHPLIHYLLHTYGPSSVVQLSEKLFCLPVSKKQIQEGLEKYSEQRLDEIVGASSTGIWIVSVNGKPVEAEKDKAWLGRPSVSRTAGSGDPRRARSLRAEDVVCPTPPHTPSPSSP